MNVNEAVIYRKGLESEIKDFLDKRIQEFKKETGLNIDNIKIDIAMIREDGNVDLDGIHTEGIKQSFVYSVDIDVKL
ncbi:MAG: hypothetical protein WC312_07865 [Candidatus Omnitrophota bacterium]|jgi:hypothetical protein